MANLKEVRDRIKSVNNTQQITKAMKLVAASKLKRATDRITKMRPYSLKLSEMLQNIMSAMEEGASGTVFNRKADVVENALVVLVTSDRGLCGGFNSSLLKETRKLFDDRFASQLAAGNLTLMPIGKKGNDAFGGSRVKNLNVDDRFVNTFADLNFGAVSEITEGILDAFEAGDYQEVVVVYAEFKNAATQIFHAENFLPIAELEQADDATAVDYLFEPSKNQLIEELVPKILKTQFFRYLLDSNASEQGARMVAMDQATENANDLLKDLKLAYNRERQAAITNEILEIVGGAAALEAG